MPQPTIGQHCKIYGVWCQIIAIHPFGTIDVEAIDGSGRWWRVSGLAFLNR
jgi:hypothetical protein